jgi:nitrogen-specific signal transduction histidine kinase/CheY-like chemotaxis protein
MKIDVEKLGHLVSLLQSVWVQLQYLLAEKYLYDSRIKEQEAEKLKSTFMANISHELRSPLNSIIGFSSLISKRNVNENDRHKYSEIISTSGKSLLTLVNDIIDFSKMEAGELSINISPCLVNNLLDQIYTSFLERCKEKGIQLSLYKAIDKQFFSVDTDILRLRQVINNLLENALKFTSEGEISFGYRIVNGEIVFFVKDTGIGISESDHKSIFNTFYQVDNDTRRQFGGSGLGLAITKTLVNLLGGDIFVRSEPGSGAEFSFTIAVSVDPDAVKIGLQKLNRVDYDFDKKRILVLGTEPDECLLLHEIFKNSKADLNCMSNTEKNFDKNFIKSYDAVIYDLKSLELKEDIYLIEIVDSGLPVIIQSAIPAREHDETFMNQIDTYLVKPFEPEDMLRAVYEVFNKNR